MAPTVSFEQLLYDTRLLNTASARGREEALLMRDLHADSDSHLDPQAYVLRPDVVLDISKELVKTEGHYERSVKAAELAIAALKKGYAEGRINPDDKDEMWLDTMEETVSDLPSSRDKFIEDMMDCSDKFEPKKYNM